MQAGPALHCRQALADRRRPPRPSFFFLHPGSASIPNGEFKLCITRREKQRGARRLNQCYRMPFLTLWQAGQVRASPGQYICVAEASAGASTGAVAPLRAICRFLGRVFPPSFTPPTLRLTSPKVPFLDSASHRCPLASAGPSSAHPCCQQCSYCRERAGWRRLPGYGRRVLPC